MPSPHSRHRVPPYSVDITLPDDMEYTDIFTMTVEELKERDDIEITVEIVEELQWDHDA